MPSFDFAVGLGAVAGDHLAAHRPAECRQRTGGLTGLDRRFGGRRFFNLGGGLGQPRALRRNGRHRSHLGRGRRRCGGRRHGGNGGRLRYRGCRRGLRAGHGELLAELEFGRRIETVGLGEIRHRHVIATGDAEQRIAAIDDMNGGSGRRGNDLARRRGQGGRRHCGRCNRRGLARNDQLLARRQRARTLVAVGLQDRGGRNIVAARQRLQRVAGADDDRGAGYGPARVWPRPSAARRSRWSRSADGPAAHRTQGPALLPTRRSRRSDRTAVPRSAAARPRTGTCVCGREYCGSSRRST